MGKNSGTGLVDSKGQTMTYLNKEVVMNLVNRRDTGTVMMACNHQGEKVDEVL